MDYPGECFNIVIDKGTLDTVVCGDEAFHKAVIMLREVARVLKPGGVFFMVSHGAPATRLSYLDSRALGWNVQYVALNKPQVNGPEPYVGAPSTHFLYICTKNV
jgi:hypothetical protein